MLRISLGWDWVEPLSDEPATLEEEERRRFWAVGDGSRDWAMRFESWV